MVHGLSGSSLRAGLMSLRVWIRLLAIAACLTAWSLGAEGAAAAWSMKRLPTPTGAEDVRMYAVSCTSSNACTAVGSFFMRTLMREGLLVERWNGHRWFTQATPGQPSLNDVSCTSSRACTAVGGGPIVLRWNGSGWFVQATPHPWPPGSSATGFFWSVGLNGVSCSSAAACVAVGLATYENDSLAKMSTRSSAASLVHVGGVIERWNGKTWSIQPSVADYLDDVSCTSRANCMAVGWFGTIWRWNKGRWSSQRSAIGDELEGVSCSSSTACVAVGGGVPERWTGEEWSAQSLQKPAGSTNGGVGAVSCVSAVACAAVGSYAIRSNGPRGLVEVWNGSTWSPERIPPLDGARPSSLSGVSCVSVTACVAVGSASNGRAAVSVMGPMAAPGD
jgi:hypothetical protein